MRNRTLDMTKFVLSVLVVMIHVFPFQNGFFAQLIIPLLKIAVPMFFIISGYFLFLKINCADIKMHSHIIKNYCIRNLKLYLVWFILLFPITNYFTHYTEMHPIQFIKNILVAFLFDSTFRASWFLVASVIGILIVYYVNKIASEAVVWIVGGALFLVCTSITTYGNSCLGTILKDVLKLYPGRIQLSFPVAILWICIGKFFADNSQLKITFRKNWLLCIVSIVLLIAEHMLVQNTIEIYESNCYIMLIPVCILLFNLLLQIDCSFIFSKDFANISTILYCSHFSVASFLASRIITSVRFGGNQQVVLFIITLIICIGFSLLVILGEKKGLQFLSVLH